MERTCSEWITLERHFCDPCYSNFFLGAFDYSFNCCDCETSTHVFSADIQWNLAAGQQLAILSPLIAKTWASIHKLPCTGIVPQCSYNYECIIWRKKNLISKRKMYHFFILSVYNFKIIKICVGVCVCLLQSHPPLRTKA